MPTVKSVRFPVRNPVIPRDLLKRRVRHATIDAQAQLFLPTERAKPYPAMIVLEGLGGIISAREPAYGRQLAEAGIAALVIDTFGSRNAAHDNHALRALRVSESMMIADAFGGLDYLRRRGDIAGDRIGVMGFSYGGMVSVLCAYEQIKTLFSHDGAPFAAHVSYYGCSVPRLETPVATGAPVLMMAGELDRNINIGRSRDIADDLARGGAAVDFHLFPETYHQWDTPRDEPHFVKHALLDLAMRLETDGTIRDEGMGLAIRNRAIRAVALARGTDFNGYRSQFSETATAQSTALLMGFLDSVLAPVARTPRGVRAAAVPAE